MIIVDVVEWMDVIDACNAGYVEVVKMLVRAGANVNIVDDVCGIVMFTWNDGY